MTWLSIKRVVRAGFLNFWRNSFVSFASVLMMVFTLFVIGLALFSGVILKSALQEFRDKADLNVYFTTNAPETDIFALQDSLRAQPQVASVTYLSREEALAAFRERHKNDQLTLQALEELGDNPLGAVLTVKAKDISQYDGIAKFLSDKQALGEGSPQIIEKINYYDEAHRRAIDTLSQYTNTAQAVAVVLVGFFVLMTIAITFNTLRITIYASRDEIHVMRLVGAGQSYIRAPFVVEGILYGLVAGLITLLLLYPLSWWLGTSTASFFGSINVFTYFITNFFLFFAVIMGSGIILGALSSYLAVRRYLKI
jgi:cell division transport system permease protein